MIQFLCYLLHVQGAQSIGDYAEQLVSFYFMLFQLP